MNEVRWSGVHALITRSRRLRGRPGGRTCCRVVFSLPSRSSPTRTAAAVAEPVLKGVAPSDPAWRRAVSEDAHVRPAPASARGPPARAFAWLPDPFAALDALGELGYALEDFTDHGAVMCAPLAALIGPAFGQVVDVHDRTGARPGARPR
jgi:hypothetical protein